ncbi:MAG: MBL fold metallo-hydrolase [Nitrososphaerales archaeon]
MVRLARGIHSIDGLEHPFGIGIVVYVVEESPHDLTLVDAGFLAELPKLKTHLQDEGYDIKDVKRLVLTHTHVDHVQAANEVKKASGARIFSHWAEAGYLGRNPPYNGPPSHEMIQKIADRLGITMEDIAKKFGKLGVDPIPIDEVLNDGDSIGRLKVVHSPGHTPGHIAVYSSEDRTVIGGDFLFKSVLGVEGLFVPDSEVSIDPLLAAVSARRISQLHFEKLLLGHQDAPILENASEAVERAANLALDNKRG